MQGHNQRAFRRNVEAFTQTGRDAGAQLQGVQKVTPQAGPGLPGHLAAPAPPLVEVGSVPPGFPATAADARRLSHEQLSSLAMAYNDAFGVLPEDSVLERRVKFQSFLQGL